MAKIPIREPKSVNDLRQGTLFYDNINKKMYMVNNGILTSITELTPEGIRNVKDFGAIGDGQIDDTTAIQNAINSSNSQIIYFPPGEYLITNSLAIPSNTYILGTKETIITIDNTTSSHYPIFTGSFINNVVFDTLKIKGKTEHMYKGIEFNNANNVIVKNIIYQGNMNDSIIEFTDSNNIIVSENIITGNDWNAGIVFYGNVQNVTIEKNYISGGNAYYPIDIEPSVGSGTGYNILIINNTIKDSVWDGIQLQNTTNGKIINNQIDGITDSGASGDGRFSGIKVVTGNKHIIKGNIIKNCQTYGIILIQTEDIIISNNLIEDSGIASLKLDHNTDTVNNIYISKSNKFNDTKHIEFSNLEKIKNITNDLEIQINKFPSSCFTGFGNGDTYNPIFTLSGTATITKDDTNTMYSPASLKISNPNTYTYLAYSFNMQDVISLRNKTIYITLVYKGEETNDLTPLIKITDETNTHYYSFDSTVTEFTSITFPFEVSNSATSLTVFVYATYANGTNGNLWLDSISMGNKIDLSKMTYFGTSAPTSGTWKKGDIVKNATPSPGNYIGWICTTDGNPGTWKGYGLIET